MSVPATPAAAALGNGYPFVLNRYNQTVNLWRSREVAEADAYVRAARYHHGHILCFVIMSRCDLRMRLMQAEAFRGWYPDGTPVCYLELSPCDLNPDKMLRRQIRLRNVLHILLPPPVTHDDFRWAIDLIVAYSAQQASNQPLPPAPPPVVFDDTLLLGPNNQAELRERSKNCIVS